MVVARHLGLEMQEQVEDFDAVKVVEAVSWVQAVNFKPCRVQFRTNF